jgi:hypothetical protein
MWNPQNVFAVREIVLSSKRQGAAGVLSFDNALADAEFTRRLVFDPGMFAQISDQHRSDVDKTGKGHPFASRRVRTDWQTQLQLAMDADYWLAGWALAFCMGDLATVGAGPYTHTMKFLTNGAAPYTSVYCEDTADQKIKLASIAVASVELSGTGRGVVSLTAQLVGSGKWAADALAALPALPAPAEANNDEVLGSDLVLKIGAHDAVAAFDSDRVEQWRVSITNDIETRRGPGSKEYATSHTIGRPNVKVSALVDATDADDMITLHRNATERDLQLTLDNGAAGADHRKLDLMFTHLYFAGAQPTANGKLVAIQMDTDESSILKVGADEPLVATVINGQATYLGIPA